jgi:glyoxylase-like metal-dependent hydrolase (beta-lactamase superfamily II)
MKIQVIPVTPLQQNCSVLWCEKTLRCAVVDPGGEIDRVLEMIADEGLTLEKILLTHGHVDHAAGTAPLARRCHVPIEGPHTDDLFWIQRLPADAASFGLPPADSFTPDRWLSQGDTVTVGELTLEVRHCPGHTPGHVVFFHRASRFAIVGDVLFKGSVGRWDFPGGNQQQLIRSIRENLFPLGDDVRFLPGHGSMSTFGDERRSNPFVADRLFPAR